MKVFLFVASLAMLSSCQQKNNNHKILTTVDNLVNFGYSSILVKKGEAFSGNYYTYIDVTTPYSLTFNSPLVELSDKKIKAIKYRSQVRVPVLGKDISLVCSIEAGDTKVAYLAEPVSKHVKKINTWTQIEGEVQLPEKVPYNAVIKVYLWSPVSATADADDMEIEIIN